MAGERFRDALAGVAAGDPAPAAVEAHLASCEACREELAALRRALALVDEKLSGLAAAEPSPELPAGIRQVVAEFSDASSASRLGWLWPATAAAATVVVALAVWLARSPSPSPETRVAVETPVVPRDSVSPGSEGSAESAIPRAVPRPGLEDATGAPGPSSPRRPLASRSVATPEVLVPPGQQEALLRLVALVHREGLSPAGLAAAALPPPDLAGPPPLDIPPLEIVPLDPAESSGT
jgi:hypothetical protein